MTAFALKRTRDLLIVLFLVGTSLFFLLHMIPGSPAATLLGEYATPEQIQTLEANMGLNKPLWEQYVIWLGNTVRGDLGFSFTQNSTVLDAIARVIGPTLVIAIGSTVLAVVIAIPLAVFSVARPDLPVARALITFSSFGLAVPGFWLALILVLFFAVNLRLFPVSGYASPLDDPLGSIWYLFLPMVVLLSHQVSLLVMTLREGLSGEMLNAYVRSARAKGANERTVLYRHLLPNALLPTVTVVGGNFGALLGGVVILETVFLIPGMGSAMYTGIQSRDYNLILGITLVSAAIIVVINLLVDVLYGILDPRVRVQ